MSSDYFEILQTTPTRVWVNNPTLAEIDLALAQGAVGCTTNPAFGGGLLRRAPAEILPVIADAAARSDDDERAAELVQLRLVERIADRFRPLHEATDRRLGFVSIQGSPVADGDPEHILGEAREGAGLGPNVAPKIPATEPGLEAFERLVADGQATIVTEVFSLAQLVETCERYLRVTARSGRRPPFFLSPITGIFGDHLKAVAGDAAAATGRDAELAGVALSRACQNLVQERGYPVTLLCGGARIPFDLTGLVGAPLHATINWSTFAEVLADDAPFVRGIDEPIDPAVIDRLTARFDDFAVAMRIDGLAVPAFESFGPVQHFRSNFLAGWMKVRDAIAARRGSLVGA